MPYKLMQDVNDSNIQNFLGAWMDNKVRALVFEPKSPTRLRYLIVAYEFRSKVTFGSVQMNSVNCQDIIKRFKIHPKLDTLLIFNENIEQPVASLSMSDIPTKAFANLVSSNQYLALPRLSSQAMLEGICPAEWNRPRKRLCVILITENTESHNFARDVLRQMALQSVHKPERVRFAYIFKDKQADFINAISKGSSDNTLLRIVVIWRRDTSHIKYEWVSSADLNIDRTSADLREKYLNVTKQNVDNAIQRLLRSSEELSYDAFVKVCDHELKIQYVDASHPGACHDSFIWNASNLRAHLEQDYLRGANHYWLLGDAGYPLEPWLLTPHKSPEEGSIGMKFNEVHSKCRNVVERTIGVLKNRWRCLLGARELHYGPKKAAKITNVCCALHNICIYFKCNTDYYDSEVLENVISPESDVLSLASIQYLTAAQNTRNNTGNNL